MEVIIGRRLKQQYPECHVLYRKGSAINMIDKKTKECVKTILVSDYIPIVEENRFVKYAKSLGPSVKAMIYKTQQNQIIEIRKARHRECSMFRHMLSFLFNV
jgi:hypothetical protein